MLSVINNGFILQWLYDNAAIHSGWITASYPITLTRLLCVSNTLLTAYNQTMGADLICAHNETTSSIRYYVDGNVITRYIIILGI